MKKLNIVIAYSDVAGGHKSAATAISSAFKQRFPQANVTTIDLIEKINKFPFQKVESSWEMVTKYKFFEALTGIAFRVAQIDAVHGLYSGLTEWRMYKDSKVIFERLNPDIVISTHLIVSNILQNLKRNGASYKTVSIASDLVDFPRPLADINADLVFSPTESGAVRFQKFGIPPERIAYPFFPINPSMQNFRGRELVLKELGLDSNLTTILLTGGGLGTTSMLPAIRSLSQEEDIQIIIAAGKDAKFKKSLEEEFENNNNIAILSFVNNFQDYINASDIIVAKPGPATIVEIELFKKKAVFTRHIGIQEVGNLYFLDRNPNFRNIGDHSDLLLPTLRELIATKYIEFEPRFRFDASLDIVDRIMELK